MKPQVFVADQIHESAREILERHSKTLKFQIRPYKDIIREIDIPHILICRAAHRIDKKILERAKHLKLIVVAGVGLDNIDVEFAKSHGVEVSNAQEANVTSTAELAMGLIIGLSRNLAIGDSLIRRKKWRKDDLLRKQLRGVELRAKTLGIVGFGRVGSRVAARAKAFEMNVIACDPYIHRETAKGIPLVSLKDLLEKSDFVSLHLPLNDETRKMLNSKTLKHLKPDAFLINTARGPIVDERAVVQALKNEKLAGYAADVFETEPPAKKSPLLKAPKTFLTPHLGAQTHEAQKAVSVMAVSRVIDFIDKRVSA